MGGKRQKIQLSLAFATERRGEAHDVHRERTEPLTAKRATESPAYEERLMEEVCQSENLEQAWKRVRRNKGGPGVDGMTIDDTLGYLWEHLPTIRERLLLGTYTPQPVKRVEIPKPDGGSGNSASLCRRSPDSTSCTPGTSRAMGLDVFRTQLRISSGTFGASGGNSGPAVCRCGLRVCGGYRSGEVLRSGEPRCSDVPSSREDIR